MKRLVSAVSTPAAIAVVPAPSVAPRIARRSGFARLGFPAPEKEEPDHRGDRDQHTKSNDRIVHAIEPRSSEHTRSAGR